MQRKIIQQNQPKIKQFWGIEFRSTDCTSSISALYPVPLIAATICSGLICIGLYQTNPSVKLILDAVTPSRPERDDLTIATQPPQVSPLKLKVTCSSGRDSSCDKTGVVSNSKAVPKSKTNFRINLLYYTVKSFNVSSGTYVRDPVRYQYLIRSLPSVEMTCRSQL